VALGRVLAFLEQCRRERRSTDFEEVRHATHLSVSNLRRIQRLPILTDRVEFIRTPGQRTIWQPLSIPTESPSNSAPNIT